jgi:hypothetical protein
MKLDLEKMKLAAGVVAAVAVVGAGSYWWAASSHSPKIVTVSQTACGLPATAASFGVPLATLREASPTLPVSLGPIDAAQAGGLVTLKFDPKADGRGREVTLENGVLRLPVTFGRDDAVPERIVLTCRDGSFAQVRYQGGGRAASTFTVVHQQLAEAAEEPTTAID